MKCIMPGNLPLAKGDDAGPYKKRHMTLQIFYREPITIGKVVRDFIFFVFVVLSLFKSLGLGFGFLTRHKLLFTALGSFVSLYIKMSSVK